MEADVYWISSGDPDWTEFLLNQGVSRDRILDLAFAYGDEDTDLDAVLEMEKHSAFKASAMIMSDRLLRHKSREKAYSYISSVYKLAKKFLTDNGIDVIFSESTWTLELVIAAAAKKCGVEYLSPLTTRIPNGRFTFYKGIFHEELFFDRPFYDSDLETAEECYNKFVNNRPVPDYAHLRRDYSFMSVRNLKKVSKHLPYMLFHKDKDMTRPDLNHLFEQSLFRRNNAKRLRRMRLSKDVSFLKDMKYCLYNLHMQPEAGIDILSAYHSDQFNIIQNVARSIPADCVLVVKEHPLGVGDRIREFYNAVNDIPNTILVHPEADNWELMTGALVFVTVAGTGAYQAALLGTPTIVFADMFYNELPMITRCRDHEELPEIIEKCLKSERNPDRDACIRFLAKVIKNSFPGAVSGREISDNYVCEDNFSLAAKGFNAVLSELKNKKPSVIR